MRLNGKQTQKQQFKNTLEELIKHCHTKEQIERELNQREIATYRRGGKFYGLKDGRRRYRLRSLVDLTELEQQLTKNRTQKSIKMKREITSETVEFYIKSLGLTQEQVFKEESRENPSRTRVMNKIFKEFTSCSYSASAKSFYTKIRVGNRFYHKKFKSAPDYENLQNLDALTKELQRWKKGRERAYEDALHQFKTQKKNKNQDKSKEDERER